MLNKFLSFQRWNRAIFVPHRPLVWMPVVNYLSSWLMQEMPDFNTIFDYYSNSNRLINASNNHAHFTDFASACLVKEYLQSKCTCTSVAKHTWYYFENHRWVKDDSSTNIQLFMSKQMVNIFDQCKTSLTILSEDVHIVMAKK